VILVDTCIWIDAAKRKNLALRTQLATMPLATCGVVRAELLCGAHLPSDRVRILNSIASCGYVDVERSTWDILGDNLALLRKAGLCVPFSDALLASLAIELDMELWTHDAHFSQMQTVLSALKLFTPPP
jgi:predicted nucleic acid-binding protein